MWSERAVEDLKRLWGDGKSASQIAAELGGGITRCSVIGKAFRLGLSGRAKPKMAQTPKPRRSAQTGSSLQQINFGNTVRKASLPMLAPTPIVNKPAPEAVVIPICERVTITQLREVHCRWPMGEPSDESFRYCGADSPIGESYCAYHRRIAYQPTPKRIRASRARPRA